jgi:fumarylpyruvate hydrolase
MTELAFPPPDPFVLPCADGPAYPVRRILCIGRNYAAHAAEMGAEVERDAPFHFLVSPLHAVRSGATVPYPPGTSDLHHEVELAVALDEGGAPWAWGVALDMTRRDLQARAKAKGQPWDAAKDFEGGAVLGPLRRDWAPEGRRIRLTVNGAPRQDAALSDMVHDVPALIAHLGTLHRLGPGDVILTGTPEGVGAVGPGDRLVGTVEGLDPVILTVGPPA